MKKNKIGFSLVELLVTIAIIGIIGLAAGRLSFNELAENQNILMFSNEVHSNIEKIRNNSLLGKGVARGAQMEHPQKWVIKASTSGTNGEIKGYFSTGGALVSYDEFKVNFANSHYKISKLTCYNAMGQNPTVKPNIDIEIVGSVLILSGCTSPNNKILEIETTYKNFRKIIRINTISGMIEKI